MIRRTPAAALGIVILLATVEANAGGFQDVLDTAATPSRLAAKTLLNGVTLAGTRLVAVGWRGHVVYSDDRGQTWSQAAVPVSCDLVAVRFPSPQAGWAVGHNGVVLHSSDRGTTWTRQLDGRAAVQIMLDTYAKRRSAEGGGDDLLQEARRLAEEGPDKPFLDVWFDDERNGFIVGTFNLIFHTADGGKSWEPWYDRTDNPKRLHLYAVRRVGDDLFVAGEQGLVLKLDEKAQRFRTLDTPLRNTFFGITGKPGVVIVFGLGGHAMRSLDGGRRWEGVATKVAVGLTGATVTDDGRIVLVSQEGHVLVSTDDGASFTPAKLDRPFPAAAIVAPDHDTLTLAGLFGMYSQRIK
jgi:photosystem II stability/assembly factor-like uncharacterized protein